MEETWQKSTKNRNEYSMEKGDQEGEEEDFLVGLLDQYRCGKNYGSPGKSGLGKAGRSPLSSAAATASPSSSLSSSFRKEEEDDKDVGNYNWSHGSKPAHRGASSVSSRSEVGIDETWEFKSENFEDQSDSTGKTDNRLAVIGTGEARDTESETTKDQTGSTEKTDNRLELILPSLPNTEQSTHKSRENVEIEESKNTKLEASEKFDLEELLATQETYELYCPNCSSCITRRIIFKERKREQHEAPEPEQPNRENQEVTRESESPSEVSDTEEERNAFRWLRFLFRSVLRFGFFYPPGDDRTLMAPGNDNKEPVQQSVEEHDLSESKSEDIPPSDLVIENEDTIGLSASAGDKPEEDLAAAPAPPARPSEDEEYDVVSSKNKSFFQSKFVFLHPKSPTIFSWWKPTTVQISEHHQKVVEDEDEVEDDADDQLSVVSDTEPTKPHEKEKENKVRGLEIVKSIVYGGLDESIKSLGIVSSAAGSGAKTLNILALGLANVVGGLSLFTHNLRDLKNQKTGSNTETSEDRYKELLGGRENFRIHFFLAIISYIFFGLIPPLVYAYSYHQTGIKDYTLVSVFLVSLLCITLLGLGKVYAGKQPKSYVKTMVYYTTIVVSSSGISFVVGDIAGKFIEKLGWFKPNQEGGATVSEGFEFEPNDSGFITSSGIRYIVG